ncbi:hypothetical protein BH24ACT6_BH24ACT6_11960 [soil metagenome]
MAITQPEGSFTASLAGRTANGVPVWAVSLSAVERNPAQTVKWDESRPDGGGPGPASAGQRVVARTMVQGKGERISSTSNTLATKRRKPQRVQWLTWPGVLPQSRM